MGWCANGCLTSVDPSVTIHHLNRKALYSKGGAVLVVFPVCLVCFFPLPLCSDRSPMHDCDILIIDPLLGGHAFAGLCCQHLDLGTLLKRKHMPYDYQRMPFPVKSATTYRREHFDCLSVDFSHSVGSVAPLLQKRAR